jgi:hypothetical protein
LEFARGEGWSCDTAELAAFVASYPEGCLAADESGEPVGFVMAYRHQRSAWIGNFVVAPGARGHGVGGRLLSELIERLDAVVATVYLNAAPAARDLYGRYGFTELCRVARMRLAATTAELVPERSDRLWPGLVRLDAECWGDCRGEMLTTMLRDRWVIHDSQGGAYLGLGVVDGHVAIGPFLLGLPAPEPAVRLLRRALEVSGALVGDGAVLVDIPAECEASTAAVQELGGVEVSETLCMVRGEPVAVDFSRIASFASLGSKG